MLFPRYYQSNSHFVRLFEMNMLRLANSFKQDKEALQICLFIQTSNRRIRLVLINWGVLIMKTMTSLYIINRRIGTEKLVSRLRIEGVITFYLEEMLAQILLLTWSKTCQKQHIYKAITRARNRNRRWVMCCLINWFFNRCRSNLLS
jgi:hypothetical protein